MRYLQMIQVQRQDFNGRMLTIRRDDLRAIACILDTTVECAVARLETDGPLPDPLIRPTRDRSAGRSGSTSTSRSARRRCDYCAFATWTDRHHLIDDYLAACRAEIERAVAAGMPPATTVFVGGGTPSLVPAADLVRVLDAIPRRRGAEVTVECNPDTVTDELLAAYVAGGVNRLSLRRAVDGAATCWPRSAAPTTPPTCAGPSTLARAAGFATFNLDLIYGGAGEIARRLAAHARGGPRPRPAPRLGLRASPSRPAPPLADDPARHPDDDDQADKYLLAAERLAAAGLELVRDLELGAARPRVPPQPPLLGSQGDYLGFGCAAHSHRARPAVVERPHPRALRRRRRAGRSPRRGRGPRATTSGPRRRSQLALRTRAGVPVDGARPSSELPGSSCATTTAAVLTVEGRLLANEVALRLRLTAAT